MMILKAMFSGLKHVFKRRSTIKYPNQRLKLTERYRGRHFLDISECTSCQLCAKTCPAKAITMVPLVEKPQNEEPPEMPQNEEAPKKKKREEVHPQISYELCIFCGLCVDICPKSSLTMTHSFELSDYDRKNLVYTPEQLSEIPSEEKGRYVTVFTKSGVSHHAD